MVKSGSRRVWLLFLLLLVFAFYLFLPRYSQPAPSLVAQPYPPAPEVVAPTGQLAATFDSARPATLQIDVLSGSFFRSALLGIGTGFFISPDGLLLTAYHVVDAGDGRVPRDGLRYVGVGPDEEHYTLTLVAFDAYLDLALLQAEVDGEVPYIPLAAAPPRVGSGVVAIGNSGGDFLQPRAGEVTRLGVAARRADFANGTIELTAALSPGDSGGPVLNEAGEAVGVVSYIAYGSPQDTFVPPILRGFVGLNSFASYAVPVLDGSDVVSALLAGEQHDEPAIGFSLGVPQVGIAGSYNPRDPRFNLGPRPGLIVGSVEPNGPAATAGLRDLERRAVTDAEGRTVRIDVTADVIIAVDGTQISEYYELRSVLRSKEVGDEVTLTVQRGNKTVRLELILGARRQIFR